MKELEPAYYFELAEFAHAKLFHDCQKVWEPLGQIKAYLQTLKLGLIEGTVSPQAYLIQPELISIGKGTVVEAGAYIHGPCVIGENCVVRHGAYIRGNLVAGNQCVIGHDTEIKNAIFLNRAHAAHFAYLGDSILGNNVNLGAGTICANLKLRGDEVVVHCNGLRFPTGYRKFGAILGDGAQTGCNSVTNPGTILGKGAVCHPCTNFGGVIPPKAVVKTEARVQICTPKH